MKKIPRKKYTESKVGQCSISDMHHSR